MLSHLVAELGTPPSDRPSRANPTTTMSQRMYFWKLRYCESVLPNRVMGSSSGVKLLRLGVISRATGIDQLAALQPPLQELEGAFAMKLMIAFKNLLPHALGCPEGFVDAPGFRDSRPRGLDRKDRVARARLDEQPARRDQPGQVVHLHIVQYTRHVVVDAVRAAENAVAEGVEVAADDRD